MPASLTATLNGLVSQRLVNAGHDALAENHAAVISGLRLSFASILAGLTRESADPAAMTSVAALLQDPAMRGGMLSRVFARARPVLESHGRPEAPTEPEIALGTRLTTTVLGPNRDGLVRTVSAVAGLDQHSADALMTLAAPMVLAALQHRLAGAESGAPQVAALLGVDRASILAAVPSEIANSLGLTTPPSGQPTLYAPTTAASPAVVATSAAPSGGLVAGDVPIVPATRAFRLPDVATPAAPPPSARTLSPIPAPTPAALPEREYQPIGRTAALPKDDGWRSLLPSAIALALVGLVAYLVWPPSPQVRGPAVRQPSSISGAPTPGAGAAGPSIGAGGSDAGTAARGMVRRTLPNGTTLAMPADGFESRLLTALDDPWRFLSSPKWLEIEGLNFETGSADVTPETRMMVQRLAEVLIAYPTVKIKIGGYTDNQGNPTDNVRLSEERARAVRLALRERGIAADRLEAEGYGEASPIASNATPEGRARNRRIAVLVTQR